MALASGLSPQNSVPAPDTRLTDTTQPVSLFPVPCATQVWHFQRGPVSVGSWQEELRPQMAVIPGGSLRELMQRGWGHRRGPTIANLGSSGNGGAAGHRRAESDEGCPQSCALQGTRREVGAQRAWTAPSPSPTTSPLQIKPTRSQQRSCIKTVIQVSLPGSRVQDSCQGSGRKLAQVWGTCLCPLCAGAGAHLHCGPRESSQGDGGDGELAEVPRDPPGTRCTGRVPREKAWVFCGMRVPHRGSVEPQLPTTLGQTPDIGPSYQRHVCLSLFSPKLARQNGQRKKACSFATSTASLRALPLPVCTACVPKCGCVLSLQLSTL